MAFAPYVNTVEVREWLKTDPSSDPQVDPVVAAITRQIDEYCQRHFWQDGTVAAPVARTFVVESQWCLSFGAFNDLVSVATDGVKTDEGGDGTFETTWATSDYQLLPVNRPTGRPYTSIEAVAGRLFPLWWYPGSGRRDRVQITGVWGWPAVPDAVKQAALIQASRVVKRRESPEGVSGFDQFGLIRVSNRLDPDVEQLLAPYRRTAVLVA